MNYKEIEIKIIFTYDDNYNCTGIKTEYPKEVNSFEQLLIKKYNKLCKYINDNNLINNIIKE